MASARTDEARRECADRTAELAAALRSMIEGLTLVSRLEAGEMTPAPVDVPLVEAVVSAIQAVGGYGSLIQARNLDGVAHVDPALFAPALEGLLLYAVKFAADGPVKVSTSASNRAAVIEIDFDGLHGRNALKSLAFVELPPSGPGAQPTVGLGPALIVRMAETLNWRLDLAAGSDKRARVILTLDVAPSS